MTARHHWCRRDIGWLVLLAATIDPKEFEAADPVLTAEARAVIYRAKATVADVDEQS